MSLQMSGLGSSTDRLIASGLPFCYGGLALTAMRCFLMVPASVLMMHTYWCLTWRNAGSSRPFAGISYVSGTQPLRLSERGDKDGLMGP